MKLLNSRSKLALESYAKKHEQATILIGFNELDANSALEYFVEKLCSEANLNKADIIGVDGNTVGVAEIRELKHLAHQKQQIGTSRVISISSIDKLNNESQNTMLKMLEEPTSGLIYVASAHNPQKILRTIRSRAVSINIGSINREDLKLAYPGKSDAELTLALGISRGDTSKTKAYLEGENVMLETAKKLLASDKLSRLRSADEFSKDRGAALEIVSYVQNILTYMLEQEVKAGGSRVKTLIDSVRRCQKAITVLNANGNVKLTLDSLFVAI